MLQKLFQSSTIPLLKQFARFNERRHEVLAGNIARIDTPGYKSRDLPVAAFQQAMARAVETQRQPASAPQHPFTPPLIPLRLPASLSPPPVESIDQIFTSSLFQPEPVPARELGLQDNGKRSIEFEVMELTRTLMQQNYAMQMLQSQYNLLEAVIAERP